jgi:hypothetical protein
MKPRRRAGAAELLPTRAVAMLRHSTDLLTTEIVGLEARLAAGDEVVWLRLCENIRTLAAVLPALLAIDDYGRERPALR